MIRITSRGLQRLALPAIAATLLSLTTGSSPAQVTSVAAKAGRAVERISPEATIISSSHYEATLLLTCVPAQGFCAGDLPVVGNRRRLILTRISCYMRSSTYSVFAAGRIMQSPAGSVIEFLPVDHSTDHGYHVLNRAIDVRIAARHYASVGLQLASGGQALEGQCTAHGTLELLQ